MPNNAGPLPGTTKTYIPFVVLYVYVLNNKILYV